MTPDEAEEFTSALGQVFSGGWRLIHHAQRQGVPAALGLSTEAWVHDRLGGYVRLALPERRAAVQELRNDGLTVREIAAVVGVSHPTVLHDLRGKSLPAPSQNLSTEAASQEPRGQDLPPADVPVLDLMETAYSLSDGEGKERLDRLNYITHLSRSMHQATGLLAYDPARVAEVIDPEYKRLNIDVVIERLTNWAQRVEDAMPGEGLRVISGGKA